MKLSKISVITALALGMGMSSAYAEDVATQGQGKITFHGYIIDAACSIGADSESQIVELGKVRISPRCEIIVL
ncbi:fimbrial protein [Citrobacter farmeri]|uniref:fimbrial protein n=1 Tax=Citrobacter farmeri TaxID=67824 RepID=UPI0029306C64|nr:hypothetical protein [Citrobacter farmeri]